MFRIMYLIGVLLILNIRLYAQQSMPGFYIASNGQTINGTFPKFRNWNYNPSKIEFETNTKQLIQLTPEVCKSFTVTGYDTYESMKVKRMTNPNKFYLNVEKAPNEEVFEDIHVFLRRIYNEGSVKLYIFKDSKRENFFIKINDTLTELLFRVVFRKNPSTGTDFVVEDKKYIDQLKSMFSARLSNDEKLAKKISMLRYSENNLITFLNQAMGLKFKRQKNRYPPELVVIGGVSYNTFKVGPYQQFVYPTTLSYPSKISPVIGLSYTEYTQRSFGKNMYSGELKYYSFKHAAARGEERWEYKASAFSIGFSVGRKWIDEKNIAWYTSIVPTAILFAKNTETKTYLNTKEVVEGRKIIFRPALQTGFIFNRIGIWAVYNFIKNDIQRYPHYNSFHQSIQAGMDWRFKL